MDSLQLGAGAFTRTFNLAGMINLAFSRGVFSI